MLSPCTHVYTEQTKTVMDKSAHDRNKSVHVRKNSVHDRGISVHGRPLAENSVHVVPH